MRIKITTKEKLARKYERLTTESLQGLLFQWTEAHKRAPRLDAQMTKHTAFYHCAAIRKELFKRGETC